LLKHKFVIYITSFTKLLKSILGACGTLTETDKTESSKFFYYVLWRTGITLV